MAQKSWKVMTVVNKVQTKQIIKETQEPEEKETTTVFFRNTTINNHFLLDYFQRVPRTIRKEKGS